MRRTIYLICSILFAISALGQSTDELKNAIGDYKRSFYQVNCKSALLETQLGRIEKLDYTVVKKCNLCRGTGKVKGENSCSNCGGSGLGNCMHCFEGSLNCIDCKGSGKIFCSCAYETLSDALLKTFHYRVNCSICGGNRGGRGLLKCSSCSGHGKLTCTYCDGDGRVPCRSCRNGTTISSTCCEECKGMGRLVE